MRGNMARYNGMKFLGRIVSDELHGVNGVIGVLGFAMKERARSLVLSFSIW